MAPSIEDSAIAAPVGATHLGTTIPSEMDMETYNQITADLSGWKGFWGSLKNIGTVR